MVQLYLLSVLLNALVGLIFISDTMASKLPPAKIDDNDGDNNDNYDAPDYENLSAAKEAPTGLMYYFASPTFRLITGVLALLTGVLKIFSVMHGDIPVIGDIIPAVANIFGGGGLIFLHIVANTSITVEKGKFFDKVFISGKKYLGIFCIIAAVLHFLIPKVVLL